MLDWDGLRYFLEVARTQRVSAAALRLGVRHSTVSRRIHALELELGTLLFDKSKSSGFTLTEEGIRFFAYAEQIEGTREATRKSMGQIQGALVGIGVVLSAVFVPMAFFGGSAGIIYKQFAITIVSAMGLSVLVALMFTPALCATMLKPSTADHHNKKGFFGWFNRMFDRGNMRYQRGVSGMLRHRGRYMVIFLLIVAGLAVLFTRIPTTFLPEEDQSIMFVQVQTPSNSSTERTDAVLARIQFGFTISFHILFPAITIGLASFAAATDPGPPMAA